MENGMGKRNKKEDNYENSGPLTSLPVDRLNGDQLEWQPLVPITMMIAAEAAPRSEEWEPVVSLLVDSQGEVQEMYSL